MKPLLKLLTVGLVLAPPMASAIEDVDSFVEGNLLSIFYHELGHALIDLEGIPIFGQEEDAADVFSIFLIDALFEEEAAQQTALETAQGFLGEATMRDEEADEILWWDTHGADEQRYFNTVCIFYGALPEERADLADALDLPEERAEFCPDEYDQAADSWGAVLDEIMVEGGGESIGFEFADGVEGSLTFEVIEAEVALLNEEVELSENLWVSVEPCDEANAYYDPENQVIVMCTEFEEHLRVMAERMK